MRGDLGVAPHGGKTLHEIPGRNDVDPQPPDELDGAGVHARDVRDRAARRILHRDAMDAIEQPAETLLELLTAGVSIGRAGEVGQRVGLDRMHELAWLAVGQDQIEPSPGRQVAPLTSHAGHIEGNRVRSAKIVQQPTVESFLDEGSANGGHIKGRSRGAGGGVKARRHDVKSAGCFSSIVPASTRLRAAQGAMAGAIIGA